MNTCSVGSSIHGYQNGPTQQLLVSIYDFVGQRSLTMLKVHFIWIIVASLFQSLRLVVKSFMITRHHMYCITLNLQRKHKNGDHVSRKPLLKRHSRHGTNPAMNEPKVVPSNWKLLGSRTGLDCNKKQLSTSFGAQKIYYSYFMVILLLFRICWFLIRRIQFSMTRKALWCIKMIK